MGTCQWTVLWTEYSEQKVASERTSVETQTRCMYPHWALQVRIPIGEMFAFMMSSHHVKARQATRDADQE